MIQILVASLAFVLASLPGRAPAEQAPAPVLLLLRDDVALKAWLAMRSRQVGAAAARVDEAKADLGSSEILAPNPSIDLGLSDLVVGPSNPEGLGFQDTAVYSAGISQTIELGKRGPRIDAAKLRRDASGQDYLATLAAQLTDVRYGLGKLVYFQARQSELEESLRSAMLVSELEHRRLELQDLSGNDYNRLVLDTMALEAEVAKNQAELTSAAADCRALLLASCDVSGVDISELDVAAPTPPTAGAESVRLVDRPDLESLRLQSQASLADATLARRRAIPDPTLRFGFVHDKLTISGDQPNTIGVTLSLPLPIFDHGQYDAARAAARTRELGLQRAQLVTEAQATLDGLVRKRGYLEATLEKLSRQALPKSSQIVESTSKAFDQGQLSMTDLLLARRTHIGLVLSLMELRFDLFTVRNELRRVLGLDAAVPVATR